MSLVLLVVPGVFAQIDLISFLFVQDVDELLQCVCDADSGQEVQHFGSFLLQRLRSLRQRRNDIIAQEMKAVMEERDASVSAVMFSP